jgi:hypothetical protein
MLQLRNEAIESIVRFEVRRIRDARNQHLDWCGRCALVTEAVFNEIDPFSFVLDPLLDLAEIGITTH